MDIILPAGQHYGNTLQTWDSGSITLSRILYAGETSSATHGNERASVLFIENGFCMKQIGPRSLELSESKGLFLPPAWLQQDSFPSATTFLSAEFSEGFLARIREVGPSVDEPMILEPKNSRELRIRLTQELQAPDPFSQMVLEGMLLSTVALAGRRHSIRGGARARRNKPPAWLISAREILHDVTGTQTALEELASAVGIHPAHLSREFRRHFGCTPGEYMRRLRIDRAKVQLVKGQMGLADISLQMGFADQAHFSRAFKQHTGRTPLAYRRAFALRRKSISKPNSL